MWQELDKQEKDKYVNQAQAMRAEYLAKVKAYAGDKAVATPSKASSSKKSASTAASVDAHRPIKGKQNVIASSDEDSDEESADEQSQERWAMVILRRHSHTKTFHANTKEIRNWLLL